MSNNTGTSKNRKNNELDPNSSNLPAHHPVQQELFKVEKHQEFNGIEMGVLKTVYLIYLKQV